MGSKTECLADRAQTLHFYTLWSLTHINVLLIKIKVRSYRIRILANTCHLPYPRHMFYILFYSIHTFYMWGHWSPGRLRRGQKPLSSQGWGWNIIPGDLGQMLHHLSQLMGDNSNTLIKNTVVIIQSSWMVYNYQTEVILFSNVILRDFTDDIQMEWPETH